MKYVNDSSMVLLTNEEYNVMKQQQVLFTEVKKEMRESNRDSFKAGWYFGGIWMIAVMVTFGIIHRSIITWKVYKVVKQLND